MNYKEFLTINGKTYNREELTRLAEKKLSFQNSSEHDNFLYSFIQEWISESDVIKVKTSGTTGNPKEIIFRKSQAVASAQMTCDYFKLNKNINALLCLSTQFIGGKMMIVRAFVCGMNLIIVEPDSNPLKTCDQKIDFASMVPLQVLNSLLDEKTKKKFCSIPDVIIGGAPVSIALENRLRGFTNNVYSTFAMTETLSHIALKKLNGRSGVNHYEVLPGITISADERDCLIVNAPLLNEKPVVTNDVVEIINSTQFHWLGRYDSIINSGGIKIYPEIIEEKLSSFVDFRFFISSLPDEKLGQKVVMVIECSENFSSVQIKSRIENKLAKYEMPKEYYRIKKFIETSTGKVKRKDTLNSAIKF